jgi:DNA-binding transcriptional LysR family regulator
VSYDLDSVFAFVRAVAAGSFSAAARELGVTPSAISKQVGKLEDRLGVILVNRTSRKLTLTDAGTEFYERCARSLADIDAAEAAVSHFTDAVRGPLRVNVPQGFGRLYVAPLLPEFLLRYPEIQIELLFGQLSKHVFDERIDVLIGSADPPVSSMIVRPLMNIDRVACAAPSYIERWGKPQSIDDLLKHNCLVITSTDSADHEWVFRTKTGRERVRVAGNFKTNNHEALHLAVLEGVGIAHMPTYIVGPAIVSGQLVAIFQDVASPADRSLSDTMNAYYPQAKNRLLKVKTFVDFLIERLAARSGASQPEAVSRKAAVPK